MFGTVNEAIAALIAQSERELARLSRRLDDLGQQKAVLEATRKRLVSGPSSAWSASLRDSLNNLVDNIRDLNRSVGA